MVDSLNRVSVEQVQWMRVAPWVRLVHAARMALQPAKLLLAVGIVAGLLLGGTLLDLLVEADVYPGEIALLEQTGADDFDEAYEITYVNADELYRRSTPFATARLVAGGSLRDALAAMRKLDIDTMLGEMRRVVVALPAWWWHKHPWHMSGFVTLMLVLLVVLGGPLSRMATVHAATGIPPGLRAELSWTWKRAGWFILAPLIPLLVIAVAALLLAVLGWALFSAAWLNLIGGLLYGVLLLIGLLIALVSIGLWLGGGMLWPAVSAEGTDAFDAVSRVYHYLLSRFGRFLGYTAVLLLVAAVAYVVLAGVLGLTMSTTHALVGAWVGEWDELMPVATPQALSVLADPQQSDDRVAATLSRWWLWLFSTLLPAYLISYYFCAQASIYLLLRESSDGTPCEEIAES
jgi:hypothetical protein